MESKVWERGLRNTVLILVGVLLGATLFTPSVAHVSNSVSHLRTHLNPRYVNEGQAAGGELIGTYPNPSIATGSVDEDEILDDAVTNAKIAEGAVDEDEIQDNAVTNSALAENAVGSQNVAQNSLTDEDLAQGSVAASEVENDSLSFSDLAENSVRSSELSNSSVGSSELSVLTEVTASTAAFGSGQTGQNGSYLTRAVTVRCPSGSIALSGGGFWSSDTDDLEVMISRSSWVPSSGANNPGWRVRGGVDLDQDFVLTAQVLCLGAGV